MTYWITKGALSKGIRKYSKENCISLDIKPLHKRNKTYDKVLWTRRKDNRERMRYGTFLEGEYHETHEAALAKAEEMREKELARLRCRIEIVDNIDFGEANEERK